MELGPSFAQPRTQHPTFAGSLRRYSGTRSCCCLWTAWCPINFSLKAKLKEGVWLLCLGREHGYVAPGQATRVP